MIPCYEFESEESMKINLNTLSFSYTFEYENDIVFFSYFQPYTLTDLEDLLFILKSKFHIFRSKPSRRRRLNFIIILL